MKYKIVPIKGDASFRSFYRVILNKKSKIVVLSQKEKYKNLVAYSAINKYLNKNKILAPRLYTHNYKKGMIVIEDFGNLSFYDVLTTKKNKLIIYKQLVDLLIKIQKIKTKRKVKNFLGKMHLIKNYSIQQLHKESDLFFNWYLPLLIKKKEVAIIKKKTKNILSSIYGRLNLPNTTFVHRDYHAQNLMKINGKIGVIDSQDALIGNPSYDLVSLIDDVRFKTTERLKQQVYNYYLEKNMYNKEKFLEDFNILSVQRNLKIIGIFSRLFKRDKKPQYLKFIPYTWQLLDMRMKSKIFNELKNIFDSYIPKKKRSKILNR